LNQSKTDIVINFGGFASPPFTEGKIYLALSQRDRRAMKTLLEKAEFLLFDHKTNILTKIPFNSPGQV
jgi:hypothetical protein